MKGIRPLDSALDARPVTNQPQLSAKLSEAANVPFDVLLGSLLQQVKQQQPHQVSEARGTAEPVTSDEQVDATAQEDEAQSIDETGGEEVADRAETHDRETTNDTEATSQHAPVQSPQQSAAVLDQVQPELVPQPVEGQPEPQLEGMTEVVPVQAQVSAQIQTPQAAPEQATAGPPVQLTVQPELPTAVQVQQPEAQQAQVQQPQAPQAPALEPQAQQPQAQPLAQQPQVQQPQVQQPQAQATPQVGAVVREAARASEGPAARQVVANTPAAETAPIEKLPETPRLQPVQTEQPSPKVARPQPTAPAPEFNPASAAPEPRQELFAREAGGYQASPLTEAAEAQLNPTTQRPEGAAGAVASEATAPGPALPAQAAADPTLSIQMQASGQDARRDFSRRQAPQQLQGRAQAVRATARATAGETSQPARPDATGHAASRGTQAGQAAAGLSKAQQAPTPSRQAQVIDRIVRMARVMKSGDTSSATIRLKPPELGDVKIELRVTEGVVHSKLEVADSTTRTLLESHLSDLRGSLADEGLEVGSFEVTVRDGGASQQQQFGAGRSSDGSGTEAHGDASTQDEAPQQQDTDRDRSEPGRIDFLA